MYRGRVNGKEPSRFAGRLSDQDSVERIAMVQWQGGNAGGCSGANGHFREAVRQRLFCDSFGFDAKIYATQGEI